MKIIILHIKFMVQVLLAFMCVYFGIYCFKQGMSTGSVDNEIVLYGIGTLLIGYCCNSVCPKLISSFKEWAKEY